MRSGNFVSVLMMALLPVASGFAATPVEVIRAEFGIFDASNPQTPAFLPTNIVPLRKGQHYGWVIQLRTGLRSLSVSEEYLLAPRAAHESAQDGGKTIVIPMARRNQVSQRQLVPIDGQIVGEWEIGPGEPPGRRHLQVLIEGEVAASFEYEVR